MINGCSVRRLLTAMVAAGIAACTQHGQQQAAAGGEPATSSGQPGASAAPALYFYVVQVGGLSSAANSVLFDGKSIWVAVYDQVAGGSVKRLDTVGTVLSTTSVGNYPVELAFDGQNVWVTDYLSSDVMAIDAAGQLVGTIKLPANANPEGILYDGKYIWTANNGTGVNNVSKIDPSSMTLLATYPVNLSPDGVAFDGTYIWVTNSYSNNVTKLDRASGEILRTYPTGNFPLSIIFDGGKNLWIGNGADQSFGTAVTGSVVKMRAYGGVNLGTFPVGSGVRGLAYDGSHIWVCNSRSNTVSLLRASDGTTLGTYPTGHAPRSVAYDGSRMWIADSSDNTITVLTFSPAAVVSNLPGGSTIAPAPLPTVATPNVSALAGNSQVNPQALGGILGMLLKHN
jgi:DNA-binding beta-propeller fold protein YncE